jgi:hypothetical protein
MACASREMIGPELHDPQGCVACLDHPLLGPRIPRPLVLRSTVVRGAVPNRSAHA